MHSRLHTFIGRASRAHSITHSQMEKLPDVIKGLTAGANYLFSKQA